MKTLMLVLAAISLAFPPTVKEAETTDPSARAGVDAGNQAWIDGVKSGDIAGIAATYAQEGVDCGATGECIKGRAEIERHMKTQLAALGRASSASVRTWGSTQHGNFVYEWGQAEATFAGGKKLVDKYLTAWQKQPDGSWKIFRNMVIPDK